MSTRKSNKSMNKNKLMGKNMMTKKNNSGRSILKVDNKLDKNMEIEDSGDNKYIPKFKISNDPAYSTVEIYLDKDQTVYDQHGCMNYLDNTIKVETKSGGFWKGLVRAIATTQSFFMTYYTGQNPQRLSVASFASHLPGDIIAIKIKPGEKYVMTNYGFICATNNVELNTITRFKNFFGGGGIFLSEAYVHESSNSNGMIWVAAYGGFERLVVPAGESIKVEHGLFCVAKKEYKYEVTTLGGLKSTFFSGESFMMRFYGPCELYVNGRNLNKYIGFLGNYFNRGGGRSESNKFSISF